MSAAQDPKRAAYIAGLRKLADALEANPDLPAPYIGASPYPFSLHFGAAQSREQLASFAALVTDASEETADGYHRIKGRIEGVHVDCAIHSALAGRAVVREVETFEVEPFLPVSS